MRYRRLGRTGFDVSEIGFGAWGIGGTMWMGAQDSESIAALHAAVDGSAPIVRKVFIVPQSNITSWLLKVLT